MPEAEIKKIPKSSKKKPERSQKEMIEEVVMFTRSFSKDYFRQKWEWNLSMGMRKMLARLTPREEIILRRLYGIQEKREYSIKEIAIELKTTQKAIKDYIEAANIKLSQYSVLEVIAPTNRC